MKINCSAGKGVLPVSECLACARTGNAPCGYDYSLLAAMFERGEDRTKEIHVTDVTGCLRKAYYSKKVESAEYPHEMLVRYLGTQVHGAIERNDEYMQSEIPLKLDGLVGRTDIVYKDGRLVDSKTTRWMVLGRLPYGSHELQVNIYAYILKKQGVDVNRLQIQYIDLSGPTKCRACKKSVVSINGELRCPQCGEFVRNAHLGAALIEIPFYPEEVVKDYIENRVTSLQAALDMGFEPEKEPGFLCAYCPAIDICKPGETNEL